jgi:hypothetical protein
LAAGEQVPFNEFEADDLREARARELENATRLDVHTWSEHPEVEAFVSPIYDALFVGRKAGIKKKHLKVLLLHLYVNWSEDPTRRTAFSRNVNDYRAGSIYNELHISKLTIDIADTLIEAGLLEQAKGFYDRDRGGGKLSRVWPTEALVEMFKEARFSPLDVGNHAERLTVILRDRDPDDEKAVNLEYEPTDETRRMSAMLVRYNALLANTFIDIPTLEAPGIPVEGERRATTLMVTQRDKFVRRIFNRGSFDKGGRFYGGWWQRCPKVFRKRIFVNDSPTSEVDFSGLHIILLYAMQGQDYWAERDDDPYAIAIPDFLKDADQTRAVAKGVVLFALNAETEAEAFGAFRQKAENGSAEKRLTNEQLRFVLRSIEEKHPDVADHLLSDVGITLMGNDARITERILDHFTAKEVPVLPIHDSYIVPVGCEDELVDVMHSAFEAEMGVPLTDKGGKAIKELADRVEDLEAALNTWMPYEGLGWQKEDEAALIARRYPMRTPRYEYHWDSFQRWLKAQEQGKGEEVHT